jgi:hypothetical protein
MVDELCKGHHGCVGEIFAKTSGDQMNMDPSDILLGEDLFWIILRVLGGYFHELFCLFLVDLPGLFNHPL